jgi:hypothetical protein
MDIGSILLLLALLILTGLFIARPLIDREAVVVSPEDDQQEHEISTLLAERDRVLTALQELDFDNALGKIPEQDYPVQRALLLQQGADVLRKLDEYDQVAPANDIEERIEEAIAERRAISVGQAETDPESITPVLVMDADDEVEVQLANRKRARQDKSAGFCPQCGRPVQKSDSFCPKCGYALAHDD